MHAVIRKATIKDAPTILRFIKKLAVYEKAKNEVTATVSDLKNNLFNNKTTAKAIICTINDKPIGFAVYFLSFSTWLGKNGLFLEDLYINHKYRRSGVGEEIFKYLVKEALENDYHRLEWNVLNWNKPAINFYQSIGAKPQDEWITYRLEGEALINFTKAKKTTMQPLKIINYWYAKRMQKYWFNSTSKIDKEIKDKYHKLWEDAKVGKLDKWQETKEGSLALTIILDQFPLNMFRGQAKSFQTEEKALEVAVNAINKGFDKKIDKDKLAFLFMPFMHSEDIKNQELSVELYTKHKLKNNIEFAKHHKDIIKKFGRFPHRNKILKRKNTNAENLYLLSDKAFKG